MIRFLCDCGRTLQVADEHEGKSVRCSSCHASVLAKAPPMAILLPSQAAPEMMTEYATAPLPRLKNVLQPTALDRAKHALRTASHRPLLLALGGGGALFLLLVCGGGALVFLGWQATKNDTRRIEQQVVRIVEEKERYRKVRSVVLVRKSSTEYSGIIYYASGQQTGVDVVVDGDNTLAKWQAPPGW